MAILSLDLRLRLMHIDVDVPFQKAIDEHADFRKYKYFPLDPEYVTKKLENEKVFQDATNFLKVNLEVLCERLKNSVPFSNFRSQVFLAFSLQRL